MNISPEKIGYIHAKIIETLILNNVETEEEAKQILQSLVDDYLDSGDLKKNYEKFTGRA